MPGRTWTRAFKKMVKDVIQRAIVGNPSSRDVSSMAQEIVDEAAEIRKKSYDRGVREARRGISNEGVSHGETIQIDHDGTSWDIPWVIWFPKDADNKAGYYFWEFVDYRIPERGEFVVGGEMLEALPAKRESEHEVVIIRRTDRAEKHSTWRRKT